MCAVGGPPDMGDTESFFPTEYKCKDCDHKFKGTGVDPRCPTCQSQNVKRGK
ncbi:MAG: hydrogenase maturation nickel metallochaperone HypA [Methanotrichaceae archaeon]|nr:hydrogenase maturation nickel metallochaperone HypA [Methanotrichaceae archaeon]